MEGRVGGGLRIWPLGGRGVVVVEVVVVMGRVPYGLQAADAAVDDVFHGCMVAAEEMPCASIIWTF